VNRNTQSPEASTVALSQIYLSDYTIVIKRLPVLNSALERQRANAEYYSKTLKLEAGMLCSDEPDTISNRYCYPVVFPSTEHRDYIALSAQAKDRHHSIP
jgi:dTDP-4-amino-4,6-dideoxygalactose transaminase